MTISLVKSAPMEPEQVEQPVPFAAPQAIALPRLVLIAGCGNLGSWIAFALAKLGCTRFALVDHDHVEPHNLISQLYNRHDVGQMKVVALARRLRVEYDVAVDEYATRFRDEFIGLVPEVTVASFDNMEARREMYNAVARNGAAVYTHIDPRMAGTLFERNVVHVDTPVKEREQYVTRLRQTDVRPIALPCGQHSSPCTGMAAGALVAQALGARLRGEHVPTSVCFDVATLESMEV